MKLKQGSGKKQARFSSFPAADRGELFFIKRQVLHLFNNSTKLSFQIKLPDMSK